MMNQKASILITAAVAAIALLGCGDDGNGSSEAVFQELYDQGLTRYVGQFTPENDPAPDGNGVKHFEFAIPDLDAEPRAPVCIRGGQWTMDTREGPSDDLIIFLQGGGACWPEFCTSTEEAGPIPVSGILDPSLSGNPFADWDLVYLPYCDGSLFAGDVDRELPPSIIDGGGGGGMAYQRGLQNLTSALDIAASEFPDPERVALTGLSGGAFGTIVALPLVRFYYPDAEILVLNDSGIGVAKASDPSFIQETLLEGWNAADMIPESCPDCTENGHVTRVIEYQLEMDPNVTMAVISFSADFVIGTTFLMLPPADFTKSILDETRRLAESHPDRYRRFIPEGNSHTTLLREVPESIGLPGVEIGSLATEIDGTTVLDWVTAYVEGTDDWVNLVDTP